MKTGYSVKRCARNTPTVQLRILKCLLEHDGLDRYVTREEMVDDFRDIALAVWKIKSILELALARMRRRGIILPWDPKIVGYKIDEKYFNDRGINIRRNRRQALESFVSRQWPLNPMVDRLRAQMGDF